MMTMPEMTGDGIFGAKFVHRSRSKGLVDLRDMHTNHIKNFLRKELRESMQIGDNIDFALPYLGELALRGELDDDLLDIARVMSAPPRKWYRIIKKGLPMGFVEMPITEVDKYVKEGFTCIEMQKPPF